MMLLELWWDCLNFQEGPHCYFWAYVPRSNYNL